MYEGSGYFDPPQDLGSLIDQETACNNTINNNSCYTNIELMDESFNLSSNFSFDELSNPNPAAIEATDWDPTVQQQFDEEAQQMNLQFYGAAGVYPYPNTIPDLNLLQLPTTVPLPPSSMGIDGYGEIPGGAMCDLGYNNQLPHHQDVLRDLFGSLPQNYGLFCGAEEREAARFEQEMNISVGRVHAAI